MYGSQETRDGATLQVFLTALPRNITCKSHGNAVLDKLQNMETNSQSTVHKDKANGSDSVPQL